MERDVHHLQAGPQGRQWLQHQEAHHPGASEGGNEGGGAGFGVQVWSERGRRLQCQEAHQPGASEGGNEGGGVRLGQSGAGGYSTRRSSSREHLRGGKEEVVFFILRSHPDVSPNVLHPHPGALPQVTCVC